MTPDILDGGRVLRWSNVMVPMRDGVRLATDLYLPAQNGVAVETPLPLLLERTPYDKTAAPLSEISVADRTPMPRAAIACHFARAGYAVAIQDCRGRYASEGSFSKYTGEAADGADTLAWAVAQPWCDGRIATWGLSYGAHAQMALACLNPSGLVGMLLDSGGFANAYQGGIRQGGAFELKQATWAFKHARLSGAAHADPLIAAALDAETITDWFHRLPWKPGHSPLRWVPEYEEYFFSQWQAECFNESWQKPGLYALGHIDAIPDVPILLISSWYDPYPRSAVENFAALTGGKRTSPAFLVLGPWLHGRRSDTHSGDADFGPAATLDGALAENFLQFRLAWFNRLFGRDAPPPPPAVRYFRMGGGTGHKTAQGRLDHGGAWMQADAWPPSPGVRDFFLNEDGSFSPTAPEGEPRYRSYLSDPAHPVPSIGGAITSGAPIMEGGGFDQREAPRFFGSRAPYLPLASRADVLVFETAPLAEDLDVTGPIVAELFVQSSAPDVDLCIKLIDVYPPSPEYPQGFALNLTDGIQRCRFRDGWEVPQPMEPNRVYRVRVEAFPTANLFKAGHRLRLDIASSNFPHFDVNPQTGAPAWKSGPTQTATVRIYLDAAHPSCLLLPVNPAATPLLNQTQGDE
jgi:hypothetical protein